MSQRMTIDEMIAVLEAAKEGKIIEYQYINHPRAWKKTAEQPKWDFYRFRYRVKPEMVELWIVLMDNGDEHHFYTESELNRWIENYPPKRVIHLREVES